MPEDLNELAKAEKINFENRVKSVLEVSGLLNQAEDQVEMQSASQTSGTGQIDTRALEIAMTALSRIDGHEKLCNERWEAVRDTLSDIRSTLSELNNKWVMFGGAAIMTLLGVIGFLIARHGI